MLPRAALFSHLPVAELSVWAVKFYCRTPAEILRAQLNGFEEARCFVFARPDMEDAKRFAQNETFRRGCTQMCESLLVTGAAKKNTPTKRGASYN